MTFDKKTFIFLFLGFIVSTIVGTLSHEFGHYSVAKLMGYEARIHYGMTSYYDLQNKSLLDSSYSKYIYQIKSNKDFPDKAKFLSVMAKNSTNGFWIILAGPMQTILTGTIGLIFLVIFRKRYSKVDKLSTGGWLLVFLALFWLRELANLFTTICILIMTGKISTHGDEIILAIDFDLPILTISIGTGIISALVLLFVIFKIITQRQRLTFILAGLFGGVTGFVLWLKTLGPILMP